MERFGKTISKKTFDLSHTYLHGLAGEICVLGGNKCCFSGFVAVDACLCFVIHSPGDAFDAVQRLNLLPEVR